MEQAMDGWKLPQSMALSVALLALCGCGRQSGVEDAAKAGDDVASSPISAPAPAYKPTTVAPVFEDARLGIEVPPMAGMQPRTGVQRDYLAADAWKADAGPDSRGTPLFALVLDGSNEVTTAELRIGSSDTAAAVAGCDGVPDFARPVGGGTVEVDGVPFRHFAFSDAAMSHYMEVEAYRAVRGNHCLAIDLLVAGTRPEVYDPPRQPPFDNAEARAKLREALAAIRLRD
jgi:hypothetical protein